ncbi:MAG: mannose-1-phosphate guanylyltransferase [Bacteroidales bacterium]|nr:mannose-1-phosphate guanylyltransferase [Candidatus Cryptobacteroides aphodequi]
MALNIVIMAGGVGSRLYPLSTPEKPKQFLDLLNCGRSLLQLTCERFAALEASARIWIVTGAQYIPLVREQLPDLPACQILAEPCSRNTAPCIEYVCRKIEALHGAGEKVVVSPSDAYIPDVQEFCATIRTALDGCEGRIVTVGIHPTWPSPQYGYIHLGAAAGGIHKVEAFKEKPSTEVAERYLAAGGYYWNAGIFVFEAGTMLDQIRTFAPEISARFDSVPFGTPGEAAAVKANFPLCPKISIDYAVMEKSPLVFCVPSDWPWDDLGSFEAIEKITGVNPLKQS